MNSMKKVVVLKLDYQDEKCKKKAMKTVSGLDGVEVIALDTKDKKLTVTGEIDPVSAVNKLRKICRTEILTVGPAAKEPEKKKDEPKKEKEEPKPKKEEPKKAEPKKAGDDKKKDDPTVDYPANYYPHPQAYHYPPPPCCYRPVEDRPDSCVIC